jgi:hypothetical protein
VPSLRPPRRLGERGVLYAAGDDDAVSAAASDDRGLMLALGGPGTRDGVRPPDGPWTDCKETGQLITIADLAAKLDRWPWFAKSAVQAGFTTITLVPVSSPDGIIGALALLGGRPPDAAGILLVPVLVVQHLDPRHETVIADILARRSKLKVKLAEHGEAASSSSRWPARTVPSTAPR